MHPHRSQIDYNPDADSLASGSTYDPDSSVTRQELGPDTDIATILGRYGVAPPVQPLTFGEVDFDLSYHDLYNRHHATLEAFETLPEGLRKAYPTLEALTAALADGRLELTDTIKAATSSDILSDVVTASPAAAAPKPEKPDKTA